jgi:hypothetical protein
MASSPTAYFVTFSRYHERDENTRVCGHTMRHSREGAIRVGQRKVYQSFERKHSRYYKEGKVTFTKWLKSLEKFGIKYEAWKKENDYPTVPHHWCNDGCDNYECVGQLYSAELESFKKYKEESLGHCDEPDMTQHFKDLEKMWLTLKSVDAQRVRNLIDVFK